MPSPLQKLDCGKAMVMLDHIRKTMKHGQRELEDHRAWVNQRLAIPTSQGEDSEMMVLGDVTVTQQAPELRPPSKLPSLLKLGAGIALAATGAGAGAGIYTAIPGLIELLKPATVEQPEKPAPQPEGDAFDVEVKLGK